MKKKLLLLLGVILIFLWQGSMVFAQNFHFQFSPLYTAGGEYRYESGSGLLQLQSQVNATGGNRWISGLQADVGIDVVGYSTGILQIVRAGDLLAGGWAGIGTPLRYDNGTGTVRYTKSAAAGSVGGGAQGLTVGAAWRNMYQLDFNVIDNLPSQASSVNFRPVGDTQNQCRENWGVNSLGVANFSFNVVAAAPPTGFAGPLPTSASTNRGNTVRINFNALSNVIGANDLTPPIRYDLYRSTATGFRPDDAANRIITDITPSSAFDYTGGASSVTDGPDTGIPAGVNPLSDCATYYYKMRAKDSTVYAPNSVVAPQHKTTDTDDIQISVTPHDYTPPAQPVLRPTSGDRRVTLSWTNPEDADFGGVVIVRRLEGFSAYRFPAVAGDNDGAPPPAAGPDAHLPGDDQAVVIYSGLGRGRAMAESIVDGGLSNGTTYYYSIYAYDRVVAEVRAGDVITTPREQGYNYSVPFEVRGIPGVDPDAVQNFVALSSSEGITLRWRNPSDDRAVYGGALVIGTTDVDNWAALRTNSHLGDRPIGTMVVNQPRAADAAPSALTEVTIRNFGSNPLDLTGGIVYYFRVFAYNSGGASDAAAGADFIGVHQFSAGVSAGARAGGGGAGGGPLTASYNLTRPAGGLGINVISFPFASVSDNATLREAGNFNVQGLVTAINTAAGSNVVQTIGWWDNTAKLPAGYIIGYPAAGGAPTFSRIGPAPADPTTAAAVLGRDRALQISVSSPAELSLTGAR